MAEDISNYTFDFEKEVNDLRQNLGAKADKILFVEVDVAGKTHSDIHLKQTIGDESFKNMALSVVGKGIVQAYAKDSEKSSYCEGLVVMACPIGSYISLREAEPFTEMFGKENQPLMRLFTLYHETGHALIQGTNVDDDHPFKECAADAYAALRLFQRLGKEVAPLLSMISWNRSFDALYEETAHLSTTILDKIIMDSAHQDFSELTPEETIKRAKTYAMELTPDASTLSAAREIFRHTNKTTTTLTEQFSSTCLSSSTDDFAFYICAKAAQPFFLPPGEVVYQGKVWQSTDKEQLEQARSAVEARISAMSLHDIFNTEAGKPEIEPTLTEALRVSLPPHQTQFIYKP